MYTPPDLHQQVQSRESWCIPFCATTGTQTSRPPDSFKVARFMFMSAFRFLRCCCTTHRPTISGLSLFQKPLGQAVSPLVSSFLPTPSRTMSEYKLSSVTTLPAKPGDKAEAEVEGLEGAKVLLVNSAGTIQAIGPKCPHYGAPLVKGVLTANGRITCPWHGGVSKCPCCHV